MWFLFGSVNMNMKGCKCSKFSEKHGTIKKKIFFCFRYTFFFSTLKYPLENH